MSFTSRLSIGLTFGLLLSLSTPFIIPAISHNSNFAAAQTQTQLTAFSDVPTDYWAHDYITELTKRNIIGGFGDGTFRPNEPVTRAQFAAILRKAFLQSQSTTAQPFADVPSNYWAANAIYAARSGGFLSGYPGNRFGPNDFITRENALISLANGLKYAEGSSNALSLYRDVNSISNYALPGVRAAAQANIIVSYPDVDKVTPDSPASRAEVAAFVYQALVKAGRAAPLAASAVDRWQISPVVTLPIISADMSLSQTGERLAAIDIYGNSFQIWNARTGQLIQEVTAPDQVRFSSIAISGDGKQVVTASVTQSYLPEAQLSVWTAATGELLWQVPLDTPQYADFPSIRVAFTPDDREVVTQLVVSTISNPTGPSANNQLRFYQAATGEVVQTLDTAIGSYAIIEKIAFSPDGQVLASAQQGAVDLWQRNKNNQFEFWKKLPAPKDLSQFLDMVFATSGALNVSTLVGSASPATAARLDVWNIQTDKQPKSLQIDKQPRSLSAGQGLPPIVFNRLSPDGKYYFVYFTSGVAGSRLNNVQTGESQSPQDDRDAIASATFSGDGNYLAISSYQNTSIFTKATNSNP